MNNKVKFKRWFLYVIMWPHILAYRFSKNREKIAHDVIRRTLYRSYNYDKRSYACFCEVLWREKEFRNVFYLRVGGICASILNFILPALEDVDLESCPKIGKGFCLIHGHGTIVNSASVIGENCTMFHGVTVGAVEQYPPIIGDNVYIGCGAKILGQIKIGNNVKIGAGAVVIKDVPDNATVIGVPGRIVK